MKDFDELELPANRPTNPAAPLSDHDILLDLADKFSQMASDIRAIIKETAGTSKAFHEVNRHLMNITADLYLTSEQLVPMGTRVGELEARVTKLESNQRNGSQRPPAAPGDAI